MAKLSSAVVALALFLCPIAAHAGGLLEGSVGSGFRWQPSPVERIPTNVELTLGYSFPVVKLELGGVANFNDVKNSKFNVDLRPMLVVKPPAFPFYFRGILSYSNLVEGPKTFGYGGAIGSRFGPPVGGVGVFLEAGAIMKRVEVLAVEKDTWVAEGRLGFYWD
jgi:hypothetical protein